MGRSDRHWDVQAVCIATVKFLAHLVNQLVLHELVALELLTLLLENPTDDSVEVAVGFVKVRGGGGGLCGNVTAVSPPL